MFCTNCGSEQSENVKFCSKCGTSLEEPQEVPVENQESLQAEILENPSLEGGNLETAVPTIEVSQGDSGKTPVNYKLMSGVLALCIVFALVFLFFITSMGGGGIGINADEMRLEHFTGSITLQNQNEAKAVVLGSRLVTGDNIETMVESNAYILLDQEKVLRVNETSQVEIFQEDKELDIHLSKGTVFFNVTSPLTEEESLEFHTNNVVTGVRGTSGIITYDESKLQSQIVVLSGSVLVETIESETESATISAGEVAIARTLPDGTVTLQILETEEDNLPIYYGDDFISHVQTEVATLGEAVAFADTLRASDYVNLSNQIQLIGDSSMMSKEQASAFLQVLQENPDYSHVTFFDGGDGNLVMVPMFQYSIRSSGGDLRINTDSFLVEWDGSTTLTHPAISWMYLDTLQEVDGAYEVRYSIDMRGASGVEYVDDATQYAFTGGLRNTTPEYFFFTHSAGYNQTKVTQDVTIAQDVEEIIATMINVQDLQNAIKLETFPLYNYLGFLIRPDSITVQYPAEEYSSNYYPPEGKTVADLSTLVTNSPWTPESTYWNSVDLVISALSGELEDLPVELEQFDSAYPEYQKILSDTVKSLPQYKINYMESVKMKRQAEVEIGYSTEQDYNNFLEAYTFEQQVDYCLQDIDNDDSPELLLRVQTQEITSANYSANRLNCVIYTMEDGRATLVGETASITGTVRDIRYSQSEKSLYLVSYALFKENFDKYQVGGERFSYGRDNNPPSDIVDLSDDSNWTALTDLSGLY